MAHFAKVVDGIVTKVIVAEPEYFDTFIDDSPGEWVQTSYNTRGGVHYDPTTGQPSADQTKALRKNYAGAGYAYDKVKDCFVPPKPYPSWSLNEDTCLWVPPVPYPGNADSFFTWNEETQQWDDVTPA